MTHTAILPVLGSRRRAFTPTQERLPTVPLEDNLDRFYRNEVTTWNPDVIITIERKGTTLFRFLNSRSGRPQLFPWQHVLSSSSLDSTPATVFRGKRILVCDDLMRTGENVARVLRILDASGALADETTLIRIAVFGVHEESATTPHMEIQRASITHASFYSALTTDAYARLRFDIIRLLQDAGSLNLNTEHIEVRLRLLGGIEDLCKALSKTAEVVLFESGRGRLNLTVFYPNDGPNQLSLDTLPDGVRTTDIVRKVRLVQRTATEFSVVPLCLPTIPSDSGEWLTKPHVEAIVGPATVRSQTRAFYAVALLGALQVLRWVVRDLYVGCRGRFSLFLPEFAADHATRAEFSLDHIRMIYPHLNCPGLISEIRAAVDRGQRDSQLTQVRPRRKFESITVRTRDLRQNALSLLQAVAYRISSRAHDPTEDVATDSLAAAEVFEAGRSIGLTDPRISAAFDMLIDEAYLVTRVQSVHTPGAPAVTARTFAPDGEVVTEAVRAYSMQWGLPIGV